MSALSLRHRAITATVVTVALTTGACLPGGKKPAAKTPSPPPRPSLPVSRPKPVSNGLAKKPPRVILARVAKAMRSAKSVHVKGTIKERGDLIALDLTLTRQAGRGKMRGPIDGKVFSMDVVTARGRFYLRSPQLWRAVRGPAAAGRIGNRWVTMPKGAGPGEGLLTLASFAKETFKPKPTGKIVKDRPGTLAGQPVIKLIDRSDRSVLYIAATGKPYPLRIAEAKGGRHIDFTGYDAPVTIAPPPKPLSFSALGGG